MDRQIFLNLGGGNLQQGFPFVTARLVAATRTMEYTGSLPAAPDLIDTYRRWQLLYELLYKSRSFNTRTTSSANDDICIDEADITHISAADLDDLCSELQQKLNHWLDSAEFRPIERQLRKQLHSNDEIYLIIQTEDIHLRQLPWYSWSFFNDYVRAEVALGYFNFEPNNRPHRANQKVRILAILGDSQGIDLQHEQQLLSSLPGAEIVFLIEPQRQELNEQLWQEPGWNIIFFAGHSSSTEDGESGKIFINSQDNLTVPQLRNAFKKAIAKGVELAIFNSCAGLGLASELATLAIPQTIVMREPVPDRVAQEFLKYFLTAYAGGQSFALSVREAREKLQGIEGDFPGASWLPVIWQNPAEIPPTWQQLQQGANNDQLNVRLPPLSTSLPLRPKLRRLILSSTLTTMAIASLRLLGMFQTLELKAYDFLLTKLPSESTDSRLLIVGADDRDIAKYGYPLPDRILAEAIAKLQQHQPAAIGLDIFRPVAVPSNDLSGHKALSDRFARDSNLVSICFCFGNNPENSISPPLKSPPEQVGFIDLFDDRSVTRGKDDSIRRYLLSRSPKTLYQATRCNTDYSFALQVAYRYFQTQNVPITTAGENWQFGSTIVKPLLERSSGYQNLDAKGNQLLISYRRVEQIAQQVTIRDILEHGDRLDPEWIKDRVVLIGMTQKAISNDVHDTPYGEKHGVHIHAHVISQMISAVEDNRPLLWWLPLWGDLLWIGLWSGAGGIVVIIWHGSLHRTLALVSCLGLLLAACWLGLLIGGWLPLIPAAIAINLSGLIVFRSATR